MLLLGRKLYRSGVNREELWQPGTGLHEVSFALNLRTLNIMRYRGARDGADRWKANFARLRNGPDWLTGTVDWVGAINDRPWIDDFKTGKWPVHPEIKQIVSYGLFLWVEDKRPRRYEIERSVTQWPKYPLEAPPTRTFGGVISTLELEEHLDDLRWAIDHPDEVNPVPIGIGQWDPNEPLSHCSFCACREPMPGAEWLNNFRYRAAPHCWPGIVKRVANEAT